MEYSSGPNQRFRQLRPVKDRRLATEWSLTDTHLIDAVKLSLPPLHTIPIIFIPGIMGSNLCSLKGVPVWLLNSVHGVPLGLAAKWSRNGAGARQNLLHPQRTKVYSAGAVPADNPASACSQATYLKRGWGEVSEASYHAFMLWLDQKMNCGGSPADWKDFSHPSLNAVTSSAEKLTFKLPPGLSMIMEGLPKSAENGEAVEPITSEELSKRAKVSFPVYAFGYNWLASNKDAANLLRDRIKRIISENNVGPISCSQVILVTHSMGGLVARACNLLPDMSRLILGVVHGVMPATGAPVAYRRCKVGMRDEDFMAGLVIGSDGKEVTAVFAQSPGALQLLPSEDYGHDWLQVYDPSGRSVTTLPKEDPYEEIYLQRDRWWGLISEEWLKPKGGTAISWEIYAKNIGLAREFHRQISKKYHHNTFVFYGGGSERRSFSTVRWNVSSRTLHKSAQDPSALRDISKLDYKSLQTDGLNELNLFGKDFSSEDASGPQHAGEGGQWNIRCGGKNSSGDGTVPAQSGRAPKQGGGRSIIKQFELPGIQHESAYRDSLAQKITYYAITKLAAMAELS